MVKIDVISGFLGAGKTTLVKKLFESKIKDEKVVLIENEFGEIGIDGSFLKNSGVEIKEINSGCICCSLVGDFSKSMKEVIEKFNPERIIIEPSGVGKLSDIVKAIRSVDQPLKINVLATVVDGGKCKMYYKNFGEFYDDQVKQANTVIVSKTDKLPEEKILAAVELVKTINPNATVVTTPVNEMNGDKLLETLEGSALGIDGLLSDLSARLDDCRHGDHNHDHEHCCHGDHDHDHDHEHCCHGDHDRDHDHEHCCHGDHDHGHEGHRHADEVFTSWGVETPKTFSREKLENILDALISDDGDLGVILRAKGIVKASDNEKWYYFDLVAGEYEIRLGEPDYTGKLCVIGSKIDENKIAALFLEA